MGLRRTFPQKWRKEGKKAYVNKSDGTNTVLSYAFPSTSISQRCFLRIWGVEKNSQMDRKTAIFFGKQITVYLLLDRLCVFFVVVSRQLYVKKFISTLEQIKQKVA